MRSSGSRTVPPGCAARKPSTHCVIASATRRQAPTSEGDRSRRQPTFATGRRELLVCKQFRFSGRNLGGRRLHGRGVHRRISVRQCDVARRQPLQRRVVRGRRSVRRGNFYRPSQLPRDDIMATARFDGAEFRGTATFDSATFGGVAAFSGAQFGDDARFSGATFSGNTRFYRARFAATA